MEESVDKISIIVPIYNAEDYLNYSLKSICNQTYRDLEILLIDDGSTDSSLELCKDWAKKETRIKVIHKENGGVSTARNCGLDEATGSYVMFVDADDSIALNMVETLHNLVINHNADVATCDYLEVKTQSESAVSQATMGENIQVKTGRVDAGVQLLLPWAVYCKLYKRELLEQIRFENYKIAEDLLFNTEVICNTNLQCVVTTSEKMYHYVIHDNSAIRQGYGRKYLEGVQAEERCYDKLIKIAPEFGKINIVGCSISMMFERLAELPWKERKLVKDDYKWCKKSAKQYKRALLDTTNKHRRISGALKVYIPDIYLLTLIVRKRMHR